MFVKTQNFSRHDQAQMKAVDIHEGRVAISIADNGPGMKPEVKQRLFEPFFTTKPAGVGTGLGLLISYQIVVEKHGGQLLCFSELGQGTEFVIEIPTCHLKSFLAIKDRQQ